MIKPRSFLTFQYKLCPRHDTNEKYTDNKIKSYVIQMKIIQLRCKIIHYKLNVYNADIKLLNRNWNF